MWSPESEINSIAMVTTMRHSQSSSSGEFTVRKQKKTHEVRNNKNRSQSKCKAQTAKKIDKLKKMPCGCAFHFVCFFNGSGANGTYAQYCAQVFPLPLARSLRRPRLISCLELLLARLA